MFPLLDLPNELISKCSSFLPLSSKIRVASTSKQLSNILYQDVSLWKSIDFYSSQEPQVDLEKVNDATISRLFSKFKPKVLQGIKFIRLDYTYISLTTLTTLESANLSTLSIAGCRNVVWPSELEFRHFLSRVFNKQIFPNLSSLSLLGTTIYTPLPHIPSHLTPCTLDFLTYQWIATVESDAHRWEQAHVISIDTRLQQDQGVLPTLPTLFTFPICASCNHHLIRIFNIDSVKLTSHSLDLRDHVYQSLIPCPICHKREHLCQAFSCSSIKRPICSTCNQRGPCMECKTRQIPTSPHSRKKKLQTTPKMDEPLKPLFRIVPEGYSQMFPPLEAVSLPTEPPQVYKYHYPPPNPTKSPLVKSSPFLGGVDEGEYYCSLKCKRNRG